MPPEVRTGLLSHTRLYTQIRSNVIFPSTTKSPKWSLPFRITDYNYVCEFVFPPTRHMPRPAHPQFYPTNNIWSKEQITQFFDIRVKPSGLCTVPPDFTLRISTLCPHSAFVCFIWVSENKQQLFPYTARLVCIMNTKMLTAR